MKGTRAECTNLQASLSVLYVDDEPDILIIGKAILERTREFRVVTINSAAEALKSPDILNYDVIVSDYRMPDMDGVTFLKAIREKYGEIPFILFTGRGREEVVIEAINNGVDFYLRKGGDLPTLFNELSQNIRKVIEKKQAVRYQRDLEKQLSDIIRFLPDVTFAADNFGKIIGTIEPIRDITKYKRTKSEYSDGEVPFQKIVEFSKDCNLIVDLTGTINYINPIGLLLIDEEDSTTILGQKNILEYVHPESRNLIISEMNRAAQGVDECYSHYKFITGKKREIWVEGFLRKIHFRQFEVILLSLRDITQQKQLDVILHEREKQFRVRTDQSSDLIMQVDRNFQILYCNPKVTMYFGLSPDQVIGKDSRRISGIEDNGTFWTQAVEKVFETGVSLREEWVTSTGKWFDCLFFPKLNINNGVTSIFSSMRDITGTKRNEEKRDIYYKDLLVHREFTEALLDAIPISVYWKDASRRYMGCNKAFAQFVGVSQEELIGIQFEEIGPGNNAEEVVIRERELISKGFLQPYQTKMVDGEGIVHEVISSKNLFLDHQGNPAGIVGSIQDVTKYNHLIRDLKNREELFRMIITQSSDFFIIITSLLEISYISPRIEHLSGFLTDEIIGPIERYIHPDDFKRVANQIEQLIHHPSSSEVAEFRTLKRDGSYMLLEGEAVNCLDNPAIRGILVTVRDITSRRRTEIELSRTLRLFQTVLNSAPFIFALLDCQGTVIFANQSFSVLTGISDKSVIGMCIKDFFPSNWQEKCEILLKDIVRTQNSSLQEFQLCGKEENIILSTLFFPIQEDERPLIGFIGLDITEQRDLFLKLDESLVQNSVLEQMVQERTEEVSNLLDLKDSLIMGIAHELRTPLTPLTVLLPLLVEEEDQSKRMEIIRIVESNTAKIANIVEKILHLANLGTMYKIEDISEVRILALLEQLISVYAIAAEKNEITIIMEIPSHLALFTSKPHLFSVLDNITSNAVKYSKQGGTIRISAEERQEEIILYICDDGMGMTRDELLRIFDPFYKADPSRHDRSSPGLGLSVTKRLVQAIGGNISVDSNGPNMGTEVILTFRKGCSDSD